MDNSSFGVSGHPVVAGLGAVGEALDKTSGADVWSLSDDDLAATVVACEVLAARQAALSLRLLREADARDLGRRLGATSTTAWVKDRLRLRPGEAKARMDLAHRLDLDAAAGPVDYAANVASTAGARSMPATAAALAAGQVSTEHAQVIAKTMIALPGGISTEQERAAEADLAGYAKVYDPVTLANLGRHLIHTLDTDTLAEREQRAHRRRQVHLVDLGDGNTRLSGRLDAESAAMLRAALDPLAAPNPAADGTQDPRTAGQRTADALVELARRANNEGSLPAGHGVRPHLSVIVSLDSLLAKTADTAVAPGELGWAGHYRPKPPAASAAMPASAGSSPTPPPSHWMSGGSPAPSPPANGPPWSPATAAALFPAAPGRPSGASPTTWCIGPTADPPTWTTWSCSAEPTTASSTTTAGR